MNRVSSGQLESMLSAGSILKPTTSLKSSLLGLPQGGKIHQETHTVVGGRSD